MANTTTTNITGSPITTSTTTTNSGQSLPACIVTLQPLSVLIFEQVPGQLSMFKSGDISNIIYEDIKEIITDPELVFADSKKNQLQIFKF